MLATWMARLGVKTRIVDKRPNRINSGYDDFNREHLADAATDTLYRQADGLQSRTFEVRRQHSCLGLI